MKTLIIYDSQFGNTQKIAEIIGNCIVGAKIIKADNVIIGDLENIDLLIVGSPTHGGRPKQEMQIFLQKIPDGLLKKSNFAAFDTRLFEKDLNFALRLLVKTIGYAAPKIAEILKLKGGKEIISPEGFFVIGKNGPFKEEEEKRAINWTKQVILNSKI